MVGKEKEQHKIQLRLKQELQVVNSYNDGESTHLNVHLIGKTSSNIINHH